MINHGIHHVEPIRPPIFGGPPQVFINPATRHYSNPLCHKIWLEITQLRSTIQQKINPERWHGKVILILSKGMIKTSYALNIVIAAVQAVALIILATAIGAFSVTDHQKYFSMDLQAMAEDAAGLVSLQANLLRRNIYLNFTQTAYLNHSIKLNAMKCYFHGFLAPPPDLEQMINFFERTAPKICQDVMSGAARDLLLPNVDYENHISFLNFINHFRRENFFNPQNEDVYEKVMFCFEYFLIMEVDLNLNIGYDQILELLNDSLNFHGEPIFIPP